MPTHYYVVYYTSGKSEMLYRYEDVAACREYKTGIKKIMEYRMSDMGWRSKEISLSN